MFSTRKRQFAWLTGLAVVSVVGALSIGQEGRYAASQAAVQDAMALRQAISDTLSLLKDAETGQRGYLLTSDEAFLAPYEKALRVLPSQLDALAALVQDDERQLGSMREIERLANEKLDELAGTIALSRQGYIDRALATVREGTGRRLMVAVREEGQRMLERQTERLARREADTAQGRLRLTAMLVGSTIAFAGFVLWGMRSAARGVSEARRANERLRDNETALRLVTDNATDLVRVVGPRAQLIYVSPSCESILQYSPAEMFGMAPRELLHPDERAAVLDLMLLVQSGEHGDGPFVHRLRSRDGSYRWFETTYCLVRSGDAGVPHIHLTSRDITRRKAAEDTLRRQTARLQSILSSIGDGVVVLDAERRLVIINPAASHYLDHAEGDILSEESCSGGEVVIRDRSGVMRTFSVTASPILEGDSPAGSVAVYHDITEQRHAERDLLESEQRLRMLSEASFEGVVISKSGIVIDTNATFAEWIGRPPYDLVGVDGLSLFAEEDRPLVAQQRVQPSAVYEAAMLRSNGDRFPVEVRSRLAAFRGETVRIAVIRDITERRRRESELSRQAELLRTMSLRDELTGLLNRRGFQEHALQQLRLAARAQRCAGVFFLDLDGMKIINDTLGHEAGDAALVDTARLLTRAFRGSDIVSRLGGDEFAILAPDCDAQGIAALRARLDQLVATFNQGAGGHSYRLAVSVGTAIFDPQAPLELDTLMEDADRAMYQDKRARAQSGSASRAMPRRAIQAMS